MEGSKLYSDIGRGESVSYRGFQGITRTMSLEAALDTLAGGSYASEAILKDSGNVERMKSALGRLKAQIEEAEKILNNY